MEQSVFDLRKMICPDFFWYFEKLGYVRIPAQHIVAQNDSTLVFTNSTICLCKEKLVSEHVPLSGHCMWQPSLRFQNLKTDDTKFLCYFQMLGLLIHPDNYLKAVKDLWSYLTTVLNVPSERWVILHSETTDSFSQPWLEQVGIHQEKDSFGPEYYRWRYGLDEYEIKGAGITFSIIKTGGEAEEVATLIKITKQNRVIAYEFCFGVEVMIATIKSLPSIHCASFISSVLPFRDEMLYKQMQDYIATLTTMYHYGLKAGCQNNPNAIAKKMMKRLRKVTRILAIDNKDICRWAENFEILEFGGSSGAANRIITDLQRF